MKHKLITFSMCAALFAIIAFAGARQADAGHHYYDYGAAAYYGPVYYQPAAVVYPAPQPVYYVAPAAVYYPVAPAPAYGPYWVPARKVEIEYDWNHWTGGWEVEYDFD